MSTRSQTPPYSTPIAIQTPATLLSKTTSLATSTWQYSIQYPKTSIRSSPTTFFNASTPVWHYLFKRSFSGGRKKLYAYFHDQSMEIFGYGQNRFRFCNTFTLDNSHDALYFILNVWKQQSMDEQKDEFHFVGEVPEQQWLETELKGYIKNVYFINPVTDFNRSPIAQIPSLPYDMMTYFIKGR